MVIFLKISFSIMWDLNALCLVYIRWLWLYFSKHITSMSSLVIQDGNVDWAFTGFLVTFTVSISHSAIFKDRISQPENQFKSTYIVRFWLDTPACRSLSTGLCFRFILICPVTKFFLLWSRVQLMWLLDFCCCPWNVVNKIWFCLIWKVMLLNFIIGGFSNQIEVKWSGRLV